MLAAAAATFVIVRSGVFAWLRHGPKGWVDFISCPLCTGFWVGLGTGIVWIWGDFRTTAARGFQYCDVLDLVAGGALVGAVALLYTSVIDYLDALERAANRTEKPQDDPEKARTQEISDLVQEALLQPGFLPPQRPGEP